MTEQNKSIHLYVLIFLGISGIFFYKCCPTIYWGDDGSLILSSIYLTLGHPPGDPLFILINRTAAFMPFGDIAFRFNVFSALAISIGIVLIIKSIGWERHDKDIVLYVWVLVIFMLTPLVIHQAIRAEVYALQMFFFSVIWMFGASMRSPKNMYLASFLSGLMMGIHVLIASAVLPGLIIRYSGRKNDIILRKIFVYLLLFFFLGCSVFMYVPLRSQADPDLNWCDASRIVEFYRYVSAQTYQKQFFDEGIVNRVLRVFRNLSKIFHPGMLPVLLPISSLIIIPFIDTRLRSSENMAFLVIAIFLGAITLSCKSFRADNWDFQGYLLISYVALLVLSAKGILYLMKRFRYLAITILLIVIGSLIFVRKIDHSVTTLRQHQFARLYAVSSVECLPPSSVVLMKSDVIYLIRYILYIERYRNVSEIMIVSRNRLLDKWRRQKYREESPFDFLKKIAFSYHSSQKFHYVFWELADDNHIVDTVSEGLIGCFIRLFHPGKVIHGRCWEYFLKKSLNGRRFSNDINAVEQLSMVFYNRGTFYLQRDSVGKAISSLRKAIVLNEEAGYYNNLGVALIKQGQYSEAKTAFYQALNIDPNHENALKNIRLLGERRE